jgi:predicted hotdog family 3-hydroxylacyl-ACP dehydratase
MSLAKADWQDLIPHRGAMSLLDRVVDWDELRIHVTAVSHGDISNPLRDGDVLRAVHLCEYGAQAMAIHGGLLARRDGSTAAPGVLVSLRGIDLRVARFDDLNGELHVIAEKLSADDASLLYAFRIEHAGDVIGAGRAMVSLNSAA